MALNVLSDQLKSLEMLKTIFIGSKNDFDEMLVHWLSRHSELVGVVWTQSSAWKRSWKGRIDFTLRRLRKNGLCATIDEALFYLYFHSTQNWRIEEQLKKNLLEPYWSAHGRLQWSGDSVFASNVNSLEVQNFVKERQPDLAFAVCIHNYFCKSLREIPRHGVLLWHEGITPEYKGLYSEFWALHNLDFECLGYTLLRMNDDYDDGDIFCQGKVADIDPFRDSYGYMGHKGIVDSLSQVELLLRDHEAGTAKPITRSTSQTGYYTYPGLSDLIRQKWRLWRIRQLNAKACSDSQR
jgi:hypothetical protein